MTEQNTRTTDSGTASEAKKRPSHLKNTWPLSLPHCVRRNKRGNEAGKKNQEDNKESSTNEPSNQTEPGSKEDKHWLAYSGVLPPSLPQHVRRKDRTKNPTIEPGTENTEK